MVAVKQGDVVIPNPGPTTLITGNDIVYLLGKPEMIAIATDLLSKEIDQP
jgi:K+/H+ antiporter YhaU regulatory subunit KhtT